MLTLNSKVVTINKSKFVVHTRKGITIMEGTKSRGEPDIAGLRNYAAADEPARACFELLSRRQRRRRELAVDVLMRDAGITRTAAVSIFRSLESLGCGKMVVGRRNGRTRFEWHFTMSSVGLVALGQSDFLDPMGRDDPEEGSETGGSADGPASGGFQAGSGNDGQRDQASVATGMLSYPFPLRNGVKASLILPEDLTVEEAERLGNFIRALGRPTKKDLP